VIKRFSVCDLCILNPGYKYINSNLKRYLIKVLACLIRDMVKMVSFSMYVMSCGQNCQFQPAWNVFALLLRYTQK
jgi:hypothetical protein